MKILISSFAVLACLLQSVVTQYNIPSSFKLCPRSSPSLSKCVKESIEHIRPLLKDGNLGEGFQIEGLEPFYLEDIQISRGSGFTAFLSNLGATGAINFKIEKFRINVEKFKIDAIIEVPKLEAIGQYKLQMALGVLNIKGEGNMKANIDKLKLKMSLSGPHYMKDGEEYTKIDKSDVLVKIENMKLKFENLFPNDKNLNEVGNTLVNENVDQFLGDIEPAIQKALSKKFMRITNQVLARAPVKVWLP